MWNYSARVTMDYGIVPATAHYVPKEKSVAWPTYPHELIRQGLSGEVTFECDISEAGKVENLLIIGVKGSLLFKNIVERTIRTWEFLPLKENGPNYPCWVHIRGVITFYPRSDEKA